MKINSAKQFISELLANADITINGNHPWDIQVHNEQVYPRVLHDNILGFGESYMDQWWDCERTDILVEKIIRAKLDTKIKANLPLLMKTFLAKIFNLQTKDRAWEVGKKHYDLGNLLFQHMLDSRMTYTCGYWKDAKTLEEAQTAKLDLTCRKLQLKPGMRVLDIGCGWGSFVKFAAENYGVKVVGVTISEEQAHYAQELCKNLPVSIRLQDYRDVNEQFDRIVSLGMFEHVGHLNYRTYMETAHRCLTQDGLFLLHTIGCNQTMYTSNPWTTKYIFPNGMTPSIMLIGKAIEHLFVMEDWHNFGADYDKTLMSWHDNFNKAWDKLKNHYDERFHRMWNFYLLSSAGEFRARDMQLWQIVLSKSGITGGYIAAR